MPARSLQKRHFNDIADAFFAMRQEVESNVFISGAEQKRTLAAIDALAERICDDVFMRYNERCWKEGFLMRCRDGQDHDREYEDRERRYAEQLERRAQRAERLKSVGRIKTPAEIRALKERYRKGNA